MGKIGDLIVRLKLKHQDYKKGLKEAEKDTQKFSTKLGKVKGVGVAVFAAVSAAAIKIGADFVKSSNMMQDRWEKFCNKSKAGWNVFVNTLVNGTWHNFIRDYKAAVQSAEYLTEALQDTTDVQNSIRIQKAKLADELAQLDIDMRDVNKSYEERAAAARKYLNKVEPIYKQEIARLQQLKEAYMVSLGQGFYTPEQMTNPAMMAAVEKFLIMYGQNQEFLELAPPYDRNKPRKIRDVAAQAAKTKNISYSNQFSGWAQDALQAKNLLAELSKKLFPEIDSSFLYYMAANYEAVFDEEKAAQLIDAIEDYYEAVGAFKEENTRIFGIMNKGAAAAADDAHAAVIDITQKLEALPPIIGSAVSDIEIPDIIPDDWLTRNREKIEAALAEVKRLQGITDQINKQFENAVVNSLSGATQALADTIAGIEGMDASQVLAALMEPFASTMISLGEMLLAEGLAIEVFKESLKSLNGAQAIAAGIGLIALGSALQAGIKSLGEKSASGSGASSGSYTSSSSGMRDINTEMTIYVKGSLRGSDIVLSGQKTINNWAR